MRKQSHNRIGKFIFLVASVLIFSLYLVYSYNNIKGRSYLYEPVYISLEGHIPDSTELVLQYQTFNDPTISLDARLLESDSSSADTYIFKTDSSYRMTNFSIYFRSLGKEEFLTITNISAFNENGQEHRFSLEPGDLIASGNLVLEQVENGAVRIKKDPDHLSNTASLFFYTRSTIDGLFVQTGVREPVLPSLPAFIVILILFSSIFFCLYPVTERLNWNGISLGAYLLAFAILILPTGEKTINLTLALSILAGFIKVIREGTFRRWVGENRGLLLIILAAILVYLIAFLSDSADPSTLKLLKIKYGLPMILLAVAINTNYKREIQLQYAALLSGVIISVFMHLGWTIMLIDSVELKAKIFSDLPYYMESTVFSRIHHSYLSILYLASLAALYLKKDIIELRRIEIFIFSLLIFTGLIFAFSRAAILSLILILLFFSLRWLFRLISIEISRISRFLAAAALSIGLVFLVFADLRIDPETNNLAVKGLSTRMDIWANAGEIIKQKPITGHGPANYKYALIERNSTSDFNKNRWRVLNTHNQFLETAGMFGIPLAIFLVWFLLFPTGFSRQSVRYTDFIIAAAIIFGTAFFFESLLNRNLGVLVFGLCYALLIKMKTIYGR